MQKIIGIVGFGLVGRSYADFFLRHKKFSLIVWDRKVLGEQDLLFLHDHGITVLDSSTTTLNEFVDYCDMVLMSAGVDTEKIKAKHKLICELDIFASMFTGTTVAITGSFGKTSVTALTSELLSQLKQEIIPAIGNIGKPLMYYLKDQPKEVVIELSSFQLESNRFFAPDIAVLTNLYPNHLDRHKTMQNYFEAKWRLFRVQKSDQIAILPWELFTGDVACYAEKALESLSSRVILVTTQAPESLSLDLIKREAYNLICIKNDTMVLLSIHHGVITSEQDLVQLKALPQVSFIENWLSIVAVAYASGIDMQALKTLTMQEQPSQQHRLEYFATINDVAFYNDSKSTVMQTTQAAVKKLAQSGKPLHLILGGLGKGVDRSGLVDALHYVPSLKKIYCFGAEREIFGINKTYETLEQVLDDVFASIQPGDVVLFSPSGTSFDLFNNFEHRGNVFKELVLKRGAQLNSLR